MGMGYFGNQGNRTIVSGPRTTIVNNHSIEENQPTWKSKISAVCVGVFVGVFVGVLVEIILTNVFMI